jgi:hypothetical protein
MCDAYIRPALCSAPRSVPPRKRRGARLKPHSGDELSLLGAGGGYTLKLQRRLAFDYSQEHGLRTFPLGKCLGRSSGGDEEDVEACREWGGAPNACASAERR